MRLSLPGSIAAPQRGFTLIELMVVIAILAILAVIGVSTFSSSQAGARDARRRENIDGLTKSIEGTRDPTTGVYLYDTTRYTTDYPDASTRAKDPTGAGVANTPDYCIATKTTDSTPPTNPTTWPANSDCESTMSIFVNGTTVTNFPAGTKSWLICARMEANGAIFCKSNTLR